MAVRVNDRITVSPQIQPSDAAAIAAAGFTRVICNRPDGETPDQPASAEVEAACGAAGLEFIALPITGMPDTAQGQRMKALVDEADGPVLAFCRSGTRSIAAWALGEVVSGAMTREDALEAARRAGYDLSPVLAKA